MADEPVEVTQVHRKPIRGVWLIVALPFMIELVRSIWAEIELYLRFKDRADTFDLIRRPQGIASIFQNPVPITLSLVFCGAAAYAFHISMDDAGPSNSGPRDRQEADWFAYRAGVIRIIWLALIAATQLLVTEVAWVEHAFYAVSLTSSLLMLGIALFLLWIPVGKGPTGFHDAGVAIKHDHLPFLGFAAACGLGLTPLIARLGQAVFPEFGAGLRTFSWPWAAYEMARQFVFATALFGLLYPALRTRFTKPYVAEVLLCLCFSANTDFVTRPVYVVIAIIGMYCYRKTGSSLPGFAALLTTIFVYQWLQLMPSLR